MKILKSKLSIGKKQIFKLRDANGAEVVSKEEILKMAEEFYTDLYTSRTQVVNNISNNK